MKGAPARIATLDHLLQQSVGPNGGASAAACLMATLDAKGAWHIRHHAEYGVASAEGSPLRLTPGAAFDVGELTAGLATATVAAQMASRGRLDLQRTLGEVLPEARQSAVADLPLSSLLDHSSGLGPDAVAWQTALGPLPQPERLAVRSAAEQAAQPGARGMPLSAEAVRNLGGVLPAESVAKLRATLCNAPLAAPALSHYAHARRDALLLGWALEAASKAPLDVLFAREVGAPLQLSAKDAQFFACGPQGPWNAPRATVGQDSIVHGPRCAFRRRTLRAEPRDVMAFVLGGVAGHSGLFMTLDGVFRLAAAWTQAAMGHPSPMHPGTVMRFWTRSKRLPQAPFALGWEVVCRDNGMLPGRWHPKSVGLVCPSGQAVFADPGFGVVGILLTNWGAARGPLPNSILPPFDKFRLKVFHAMAASVS